MVTGVAQGADEQSKLFRGLTRVLPAQAGALYSVPCLSSFLALTS